MDGPTWEQSDKLAMRFNDEERTECTFMLHCEKRDCGEKYMYTGEDDTCPNDEMPNIFDGILCSDSECPDCVPLREEDEASVDENDLVRYNLCPIAQKEHSMPQLRCLALASKHTSLCLCCKPPQKYSLCGV